jgi:5,10-methylenetetrahydromethanopterin reductase
MEIWRHAFAFPGTVAPLAERAEEWGFDGLLLADSECITADVWIELALAGARTRTLRLGPGVTNPVSRHVAVTASAAATLHAETGGRACLGFARGDSALSRIGLHPPDADGFARDLDRLQGLLRGETVDLDGTAAALAWLPGSARTKVPVHVAATGPKVIAAAAARAEGVDLTLGADVDALRRGAAHARTVNPDVVVGAYLNVAVDDDRAAARELVRGSVSIFHRFAAAADRSGYDPGAHGESRSAFAQELTDAEIDRFALAGPAAEVRDRLLAIHDAGVDRVVVVPGSIDADPAAMAASDERFAADVLPAVRAPARTPGTS